jgi:carbamoyltransferase
MIVLGINADGHHDPASTIIGNKGIIASVEEERFNRIKHSIGYAPIKSTEHCLKEAGVEMSDVDYIAYPFKPELYMKPNFKEGTTWFARSRRGYRRCFDWQKIFEKNFGKLPKIKYIEHHIAHARSSFNLSGFSKSNIITIDGSGEYTTMLLAAGNGTKIEKIKEIHLPNSLGYLYSHITEVLGFEKNDGEGKVMGLAAYGKPVIDFSKIIEVKKGDLKVNIKNADFPKRKKGEPLNELHKNIAASLQESLTDSVMSLLEYLQGITGYKNLCLAGGVALNADMNGKLLRSDLVKDIFIQPAANDPGSTIGAALDVLGKRFRMTHNYFGPQYTEEEILKVLKEYKIKYDRISDISGYVGGELLPKGKIVGWFQGRLELGPRALGDRSILADPSDPGMKDKVNNEVKHREPWRPFAPSMLAERAHKYLEDIHDAPYMIIMFKVKDEKADEISSAIHVDNTARPQTVKRNINKRYYDMIKSFEKAKGVPVVMNTSFNLAGEPMVCSPKDAIRTFYSSGMDYLALGDYLIKK